jgi:hypothetical protein
MGLANISICPVRVVEKKGHAPVSTTEPLLDKLNTPLAATTEIYSVVIRIT